jgi:hypothetical protein
MEQLLRYEEKPQNWSMCAVARQLQLNTARDEMTQFCLIKLVGHYTIRLLKKPETTVSLNMHAPWLPDVEAMNRLKSRYFSLLDIDSTVSCGQIRKCNNCGCYITEQQALSLHILYTCLTHTHTHMHARTHSVTFVLVCILWTVHRDTRLWERPTRCTLILNNLLQLNYPRQVSNK